jgi:hypothetical protein
MMKIERYNRYSGFSLHAWREEENRAIVLPYLSKIYTALEKEDERGVLLRKKVMGKCQNHASRVSD